MSGLLPADPAGAPFPVVVLVSGVNVAADSYRWLAFELVEAGFVVVGYDWVGELFPGQYGLTPGVDIVAAGPDHYGERPTTPALAPVLEAVAGAQRVRPARGPARPRQGRRCSATPPAAPSCCSRPGPSWFPQVRAVVTYGAHTMASQMLGYPPDMLLPVPVGAPTMLIAGTDDGVVAASAIRYGAGPGARRTTTRSSAPGARRCPRPPRPGW